MRKEYELRIRQDRLLDSLDDNDNPIARAKLEAIDFILGEGDPITNDELPTPKTDEDLDKLIATLEKEKHEVPEYSAFGDPNWKTSEAQIEMVKWAKG
jgi:hypothetical protein